MMTKKVTLIDGGLSTELSSLGYEIKVSIIKTAFSNKTLFNTKLNQGRLKAFVDG
jgi:hypothetical protein